MQWCYPVNIDPENEGRRYCDGDQVVVDMSLAMASRRARPQATFLW